MSTPCCERCGRPFAPIGATPNRFEVRAMIGADGVVGPVCAPCVAADEELERLEAIIARPPLGERGAVRALDRARPAPPRPLPPVLQLWAWRAALRHVAETRSR